MSVKPIKQRQKISKLDVEKALADPNLKPVIQSALKASGMTVDSLFKQPQLGIWSKTYTESSGAIARPIDTTTGRLINETTNKAIMNVDLPSTTKLYSRPRK